MLYRRTSFSPDNIGLFDTSILALEAVIRFLAGAAVTRPEGAEVETGFSYPTSTTHTNRLPNGKTFQDAVGMVANPDPSSIERAIDILYQNVLQAGLADDQDTSM